MYILTGILLFAYNSWAKNIDHKAIIKKETESEFVKFIIDPDKNGHLDKENKPVLSFQDSLEGGQIIITSLGTKFQMNSPKIFIYNSVNQIPFYILPGETIHLKYSETDSAQFYVKDNPGRNNELNFFRELVLKTGNIFKLFVFTPNDKPIYKKAKSLEDISDLEKDINTLKNKRLDFLKEYKSKCILSDSFLLLAYQTITNSSIQDSSYLYYLNRDLLIHNGKYQELISSKLNSLNSMGFNYSPFYTLALRNLVSQSISNTPIYAIKTGEQLTKAVQFIRNNFSGFTRDYLFAITFHDALYASVAISENQLDEFHADCSNSFFRKAIDTEIQQKYPALNSKPLNTLLMADGKSNKDLQELISSHKGELILLDFWASWCVPCRGEMPYLDSLKKQFRGKKIAFLSISLDKNIHSWLKANQEESLNMEDSFLLLNPEQSPFVNRYGISVIPRYLMISKEGKVINDNTPRPSDKKLAEWIDKHLSN